MRETNSTNNCRSPGLSSAGGPNSLNSRQTPDRRISEGDAILKDVQSAVAELAAAIRSHTAMDQAHRELLEHHRNLSEQFYQREVLQPVFLTLIGIVDRCHEQEDACKTRLKERGDSPRAPIWRCLKSARRADRVDLENMLATFGVEPFQTTSSEFDPTVQHCSKQIAVSDKARNGKIAGRHRLGYRRNDQIIRPESVSVCVYRDSSNPNHEGESQ